MTLSDYSDYCITCLHIYLRNVNRCYLLQDWIIETTIITHINAALQPPSANSSRTYRFAHFFGIKVCGDTWSHSWVVRLCGDVLTDRLTTSIPTFKIVFKVCPGSRPARPSFVRSAPLPSPSSSSSFISSTSSFFVSHPHLPSKKSSVLFRNPKRQV